jgi:hypothetical protein
MVAEKADEKNKGLIRLLLSVAGRILLYGFLASAFTLAALFAFMQTDAFAGLLREQIRAALQGSVEEQIDVGNLLFDPLGGRVLISRLEVHSGEASLPSPLKAGSVYVSFDQAGLLWGRLSLKRIVVMRPLLAIEVSPEGRSNLPGFKETSPSGPFTVSLENLDVYGGRLQLLEQRIDWSMESGRVSLSAKRRLGSVYSGKAALHGIGMKLPEIRGVQGDLELSFETSETTLSGAASFKENGGSRLEINRWRYLTRTGDADADITLSADLELLKASEDLDLRGWFSFEGALISRSGRLELYGKAQQPQMSLRGLEFAGLSEEVRFNGETIYVTDLRGRVAEGTVSGNLGLGIAGESRKISGHLEVDRLSLRPVLKALGLERVQADGLLAVSVDVEGDMRALESVRARGAAILEWKQEDVAPYLGAARRIAAERDLAALSQTVVPVAASLNFDYADGLFRLAENSALRTPLTRIRIEGSADAADFQFNLRSSSVSSFEASILLANVDRLLGLDEGGDEEIFPIASLVREFDAEGAAALALTGPLDKLSFDLRVNSDKVAFKGRSLGEGHLQMTYDPQGIEIEQLRFRDDRASLKARGKLRFPPTGMEGDLSVEATEFDLEGIESVLGGEPVELSGTVDGGLQITIGERISGSGSVTARLFKYSGISFERAEAQVEFGDKWALKELVAYGSHGEEARGNIEFDPETEDWKAKLRILDLDIGPYIQILKEDLDIDGVVNAEVDAAGRGLVAGGMLEFYMRDFRFGDMQFGDFNGKLKAEGHSGTLELNTRDESYTFSLEMPEGETRELIVNLVQQGLDVSPLAQKLLDDDRLYVMIGEGVGAVVKLDEPELTVDFTAGQLTFGMEQLSATSDGAVKLQLVGSRLIFDNLDLTQGEQRASISGWSELGEDGRLSVNVEGEVNLLALSDLFEDFSFSGQGDVQLRIRGSLKQPEIYGSASVIEGFVRHKESDLTFSNIMGDLRLNGDRVEVVSMAADFAEGVIDLEGFVEIDWTALKPAYFQFDIGGSALQISMPDELEATYDGTVIFRGTETSSLLTGDIKVRNALYTKRIDPETELLRLQQQRQPLQLEAQELAQVSLDLGISGEENIYIDNNLARMEVVLDLRLMGTVSKPVLTGRVEVAEGEVFYRDRKYSITSGVIDFVNPYRLEPSFDFRAETLIKEYRISLELHGTLEHLYPELSSDPPQSNIDILHLLAVGKVRDNRFASDVEQTQAQLLGFGISGFLTKQVTGELERRAERLFGVDRFRIDPYFLGDTENATARVTIGEQITDNLSVVYSRNLSENTDQVMIVEWRLSPTVLLVATREEDGSYGVDVHMQHRFR